MSRVDEWSTISRKKKGKKREKRGSCPSDVDHHRNNNTRKKDQQRGKRALCCQMTNDENHKRKHVKCLKDRLLNEFFSYRQHSITSNLSSYASMTIEKLWDALSDERNHAGEIRHQKFFINSFDQEWVHSGQKNRICEDYLSFACWKMNCDLVHPSDKDNTVYLNDFLNRISNKISNQERFTRFQHISQLLKRKILERQLDLNKRYKIVQSYSHCIKVSFNDEDLLGINDEQEYPLLQNSQDIFRQDRRDPASTTPTGWGWTSQLSPAPKKQGGGGGGDEEDAAAAGGGAGGESDTDDEEDAAAAGGGGGRSPLPPASTTPYHWEDVW